RLAVNRHLVVRLDRATLVNRATENVHDAAEGTGTDRYVDRLASADHVQTALQTFGGTHGDGTHHAVTKLLLHFENGFSAVHVQGVVHLGYAVTREFHVDYSADDLNNTTATHACILFTF